MAYSSSCFLGYVRGLCWGSIVVGMTPKTFPSPNCSEWHSFSTQTDIEITREEDFTRILQMEEEYIQQLCEDIIHLKPDVVITEKGISGRIPFIFPDYCWGRRGWVIFFLLCWHRLNIINMWLGYLKDKITSEPRVSGFQLDTSTLADLAQHYLMRANITAIRRVRKTDNNRIARWVWSGKSKIILLMCFYFTTSQCSYHYPKMFNIR